MLLETWTKDVKNRLRKTGSISVWLPISQLTKWTFAKFYSSILQVKNTCYLSVLATEFWVILVTQNPRPQVSPELGTGPLVCTPLSSWLCYFSPFRKLGKHKLTEFVKSLQFLQTKNFPNKTQSTGIYCLWEKLHWTKSRNGFFPHFYKN